MNSESVGSERINVLVAGLHGLTASAFTAGVIAMARRAIPTRYGVTSHPDFDRANLPSCEEFWIGGWDLEAGSLQETLRSNHYLPERVYEALDGVDIRALPGVTTDLDFPAPSSRHARKPQTLEEGTELIRRDIVDSLQRTGASRAIVIYLGSPSATPPGDFEKTALHGSADSFPSSLIYALGAIASGADFVDFTPGFALEYSELWDRAKESGSQLAGRDGSTGQTMLKETVIELTRRRGLQIDGWYSTNVLGNNDGRVLVTPGYGEAKIADKTDVLRLGGRGHVVNIEYMPVWGDRKESWDAIELTTWLGQSLSVRLNWRGSDSELAGSMLLDLVRILSRMDRSAGFRPELGFFFKRPFLRESFSISQRWTELGSLFSEK